jgi:hypothetical protein
VTAQACCGYSYWANPMKVTLAIKVTFETAKVIASVSVLITSLTWAIVELHNIGIF